MTDPKVINVTEDEDIILKATIKSNPFSTSDVSWTSPTNATINPAQSDRYDVLIDIEKQDPVRGSIVRIQLKVKGVGPTDAGQYWCHIINSQGSLSLDYTVTVGIKDEDGGKYRTNSIVGKVKEVREIKIDTVENCKIKVEGKPEKVRGED